MWVGGVGRWVVSYVSCVIFLQREREKEREREREGERDKEKQAERWRISIFG